MNEPNRVVVHYLDGRLMKGTTEDFFPDRPTFHLHPLNTREVREIKCRELKAVFFVKDFRGNPKRRDIRGFDYVTPELSQGKKIAVRFKDRELICGFTLSYMPGRSGFFMTPADPRSNNLRVYVLVHATEEILVGPKAEIAARSGPRSKAA